MIKLINQLSFLIYVFITSFKDEPYYLASFFKSNTS